jgi:alcohol dehydrogenase class IV
VTGSFVWDDAGRTVVFRVDGVADAVQLLGDHGFAQFELLSTPRALAAAPGLSDAAASVHEVAPGQVPDLAGALLGEVAAGSIVALGGGRVIDTAKALAAVSGARVAAIPTTMSGAEMTTIHRLPAGAESQVSAMVRPALVIADPEAMTRQPEAQLRASSMNALAHGADSLYTPFANPVSEMAALRGAKLIASSLDQAPGDRDRASLALGSLLCAYAIDSAKFGLHHVISQTLVRVCGTPHAETNAAILPLATAFLTPRVPHQFAALADALQTAPDELAPRIHALGGNPAGLGTLGADRTKLDHAIETMLRRPELTFVPGPSPTREDLSELLDQAW